MCGIVSFLGSILRQLYLPNPFINVFDTKGMCDLFNLVIGGMLICFLSFFLAGCIYERGEAPVIGSFLYTFNYAILTFSFSAISSIIKNIILATAVYLILYTIFCIILSRFKHNHCIF